MTLSHSQVRILAIVERCASFLSLLGVVTIIVMFFYSRYFRNPTHRIIFINAFYNLFDFIATMVSVDGPIKGTHSALCQFQGFCLQMFPLADVLWTLATALNVFLVVFWQFDTWMLRRLELVYTGFITLVTFVPAFVFLFIRDESRGPIYGDEVVWCSISPSWVSFRIIFYYGPIWFIIGVIMLLYCLVGVKIFKLRRKFKDIYQDRFSMLPATHSRQSSFPRRGTKTFTVTVQTTNPQSKPQPPNQPDRHGSIDTKNNSKNHNYNNSISNSNSNSNSHTSITSGSFTRKPTNSITSLLNNNNNNNPNHSPSSPKTTSQTQPFYYSSTLFRQYALMPFLFFLILLVTWVAPTINRITTLVNPGYESFPLLLAVGVLGSLRGFWNGVLFITVGVKAWRRQVRWDKGVFGIGSEVSSSVFGPGAPAGLQP